MTQYGIFSQNLWRQKKSSKTWKTPPLLRGGQKIGRGFSARIRSDGGGQTFFRRFPIRHFFCRIEILNSTLFFDKKSVDKKSSDFCLDFQIRKNTQIRSFSNQKLNNSTAEGGRKKKSLTMDINRTFLLGLGSEISCRSIIFSAKFSNFPSQFEILQKKVSIFSES